MRRHVFVMVGLFGSSCVVDKRDDNLEAVQQQTGCSPLVCGGNSPTIAHYGMFDFSIDPLQQNAAGVSLWGLVKYGHTFDLVVRDSHIIGEVNGVPALTGSDLEGARIILDRHGRQFVVIIRAVGTTSEVVSPFDKLETYVLDWDIVIGHPLVGPVKGGTVIEMPTEREKPEVVCPNPPESFRGWEETNGMGRWDSVVFEGDRFDPGSLRVAKAPDDSWFNIGCNAHLLAKLRLTRNTIHTAVGWANEQAVMKALSGDYCNTGRTFTYSGEPLVWRDKGAMSFFDKPLDLEARWDETGAQCLGSPRLDRTAFTQAPVDFPDLAKAIQGECPALAPCAVSDPFVDEVKRELVTTGNWD